MVQTELWEFLNCNGISSGSQLVLFLGRSAGAAAPLFLPCLCRRHFSVGFWKSFCSVFLSSAWGFLFTAAIGVLFVVSSTGGCLGPGGVLPFRALTSSHLPFVAFLLFLSTFVFFSFFLYLLTACDFAFLSRSWPSGCSILTGLSVRFEEFLFVFF